MSCKKKVKEKIKKLPGVEKIWNKVWLLKRDMKTISTLLVAKKRKIGSKIKVAFLCQYIPAWNKSELVYKRLMEDSRFEVFLVCVPSGIKDNELLDPECLENDTYDYYIRHGYSAINALVGKNEWFDLKSLNCDYIFYQRPYNSYLPKPYISETVATYSRICILMYAITLTKQVFETTLNKDFFKDVYLYFAETPSAAKENIQNFWLSHKLGLRKTCFYGMPALEQLLMDKEKKSNAWEYSKNSFRVMWTPRWTTSADVGGSNFFVYYQLLLEYAKQNPDVDILIRPHPLAFDNFIRTGEMSVQEVEEYKQKINNAQNVSLDTEKEYHATFWDTSVLVSDISSMVPEYFITGKPLIFCTSDIAWEMTEEMKKVINACYIADSPAEVFKYLEQLKQGNDPMFEIRKKIINEVFGANLSGTADRIVDELCK